MTPDEADQLAKRIMNSFRGGPPLADWVETLLVLEHGRAGTAYIRLRGTLDHAPTVARFNTEYRALDTGTIEREPCTCDDGWVEAPDRLWPNNRTSTQVRPCTRCEAGRQRSASRVWTHRRR